MTLDERRRVYAEAIAVYGEKAQLQKVTEELGELITEVSRIGTPREEQLQVLDELADVYVMLEQLAMIASISDRALLMLLNREIKKSNKAGETSVSTMHMSSKINMKKRTNGTIIKCFLYVNSHYFTRREAISFNEDGFIGFAGWADQANTNPLLRAFLRWCDDMAEAKEAA
jgi:hypothetical protein